MATTTNYALRQDIIDRLSQVGVDYLADDDFDEETSEAEAVIGIDAPLRDVASMIDAALQPWMDVPISQDENDLNRRLRQLSIDLTAERVCSRRGHKVPQSLIDAAERARGDLDRIRDGDDKVPDLDYPEDGYSTQLRGSSRPIVARCLKPGHRPSRNGDVY